MSDPLHPCVTPSSTPQWTRVSSISSVSTMVSPLYNPFPSKAHPHPYFSKRRRTLRPLPVVHRLSVHDHPRTRPERHRSLCPAKVSGVETRRKDPPKETQGEDLLLVKVSAFRGLWDDSPCVVVESTRSSCSTERHRCLPTLT